MDKQEALTEFLKGLRIAINNSLGYSRQHPYFIKSTQEFREKIIGALRFVDPLKVNVSPETVFLDGKDQGKIPFASELAHILHQRKIKSVEFRSGLNVDELADFMNFLSLQPKEIIRKGGFGMLANKAGVRHIRVEELDYSTLLGGSGEEAKDVWEFLFKEAVGRGDAKTINELADNFSQGVNSLSLKKILEDEKLRDSLAEFFKYLKGKEKEKFFNCCRQLSGVVLGPGAQISSENLDKLKEVFDVLDTNDFTDILLSQLSGDSGFNTVNLELFSRLAGENKAQKIASGLISKAEDQKDPEQNRTLVKRIKGLLSGSDNSVVSPAYLAALSTLIKNIAPSESLIFDRKQLRDNYRMIILNLFVPEENPEELGHILNRINKEWTNTAQDKDYRFLKLLLQTLNEKKAKLPADLSEGMEKQVIRIIESNIWDEEVSEDLTQLVDVMDKSYSTADFFLDKIFQEKKLSAYGLKLFLKFFPAQLNIFYERLKAISADLEFLSRIIRIIAQVNLPVSLAILKEIFAGANELIKVEALDAMRANPEFDPEFLFPILLGESLILKKKALAVLIRDNICRQKAVNMLLEIPCMLGIRNRLLIENIIVIEELDIRDAKDRLIDFTKRKFFWNRRLRDKAFEVLQKWEIQKK